MKENIEKLIIRQIEREVETVSSSHNHEWSDFESTLDMLECKRTEKNYEWMSDVVYPEYAACLLTEASHWANQYFVSREYVDVYLEGDKPDDQRKCALVKKLINAMLNRKELHHYHKYMRARTINSLAGVCYAICGWTQVVKDTVVGYKSVPDGGFQTLENGIIIPTFKREEIIREDPIQDYFEYDVIDPRNVITDNTYCYSIQDKKWIIIRSEETYESLKQNEKSHGYFNLDKVKDALKGPGGETETSKKSYNKDDGKAVLRDQVVKVGDVLTRFGLMWAVVKSRDKYGNPVEIEAGWDELGEIKKGAELVETIVTVFLYGGKSILIRFQATPFIDGTGKPYKPILRGLCYIHPTKDVGMSDGKYAREMQTLINDTFNMSNDRVKLATLPVFIGDKYACEDNDEIYIQPEHVIPIEGGVDKLQELRIRDNITGALEQVNMCINGMHKVLSVFEPTMGASLAPSTTATQIASIDARTNLRANYKALTFEYTFLCDLYWMILQMSYRFMHPSTAEQILGHDGVALFDPNSDYTYQPVSSNIEQEYGKMKKLSLLDQAIGRLVNFPNPNTPKLLNKLLVMYFELLGKEYQDIRDALLDENAGMVSSGEPQKQMGGSQRMDISSNQYMIPVSANEDMVRS